MLLISFSQVCEQNFGEVDRLPEADCSVLLFWVVMISWQYLLGWFGRTSRCAWWGCLSVLGGIVGVLPL